MVNHPGGVAVSTTNAQQEAPTNQAAVNYAAGQNLLDRFFFNDNNAHIGHAGCYSVVHALVKKAASEGKTVHFWLFDPGCGSHLSNTLIVFSPDATKVTTTGMFTAQNDPMPAYFEAPTTCGFRDVKYIPTCNMSIFSSFTHSAKV